MGMLLMGSFGMSMAAGLYFLLAQLFRLPTLATEKAMIDTGRQGKSASKSLEVWLLSVAVKVSKHIRMEEFKRNRMSQLLKAAGISQTPELYQAYALTAAGVVMLGVLPCLFFFPLISPVFVFLSVTVYFKETGRAKKSLAKKCSQIEAELPRFVATIEQELKNSRDVLSILEHFKHHAGEQFCSELDVVTADMRSSSYETALTRFEARINSPMLSDVVRGLIGVLRGDDSAAYFQLLAHDFKQLELQRLKKEAQKIPPKIRIFSFLMLVCFLLTYLAIIVYEIMKSFSGMF